MNQARHCEHRESSGSKLESGWLPLNNHHPAQLDCFAKLAKTGMGQNCNTVVMSQARLCEHRKSSGSKLESGWLPHYNHHPEQLDCFAKLAKTGMGQNCNTVVMSQARLCEHREAIQWFEARIRMVTTLQPSPCTAGFAKLAGKTAIR